MAAEENKNLVRRFVDAVNAGNLEAFDEIIAEDYIQHNPQVAPGLSGVKAFFAYFAGAFPDAQITLQDVVAEENKVAARLVTTGTHQGEFAGIPATGKQIRLQTMDFWRVENGKLAEHWDVIDNLGMLQQLGAFPASVG